MIVADSHLPDTTQLYHKIIADSQTGVVVLDAVRDEQGQFLDFRFSLVNTAGASVLGRSVNELVGQSYLGFFTQAESSGLLAVYRHVLETGEPYSSSEVPYFADSINGWFDLRVVKYQDAIIVNFSDITALKLANVGKDQQGTFLSQILQTSPYAIIAYESIRQTGSDQQPGAIIDFRAVFFNTAYEQIFGESAEVIRTATFRKRFHEPSNADLFQFYAELVRTGQSFRRERYYPHLDKWLDLSGAQLFDGFLIVIHDITAQKRQAESLRLTNHELTRSNESLQQFAYVASHDLQEPLRKIISFGDMVQSQYAAQLGEQGADYIDRMQSAAKRMQTLVRDVLTYSRLTTQRETFKPVAIQPLIEGVLADLETAITEKKAIVRVGRMNQLTGDQLQLRQLFQNLLSNALKFVRPDSTPYIQITCRTVKGRDADMPIPSEALGKTYDLIEVIDNGIGFEPAQASRLFQVFHRLHGRNTVYGGTGIGLAIVQKVVDNHHGYIEAEGRPGEGATFRVLLPVD